jgi:hypothetical protein
MTTTATTTDQTGTVLSFRDRAILRAVAAGRCTISTRDCGALAVDGMVCCDQFVGPRLTTAGLIAAGPDRALLTPTGRALLEAA